MFSTSKYRGVAPARSVDGWGCKQRTGGCRLGSVFQHEIMEEVSNMPPLNLPTGFPLSFSRYNVGPLLVAMANRDRLPHTYLS